MPSKPYIIVTAKQPSRLRAGYVFTEQPVVIDRVADKLSDEDLAKIRKDPFLLVMESSSNEGELPIAERVNHPGYVPKPKPKVEEEQKPAARSGNDRDESDDLSALMEA